MDGRGSSSETGGKRITRWLLAALYLIAGYAHLAAPAPFLRITPDWVPKPEQVILLTGIAEAAGAIALIQPWNLSLRKAGAVGLALYALCVWPANVNHMLIDFAQPYGGWDATIIWAYHIPRMLLQPALIWAALWSGGVIGWPRRTESRT
ncbi:DoxX family protein [Croceicoccus naphthovorans]|uniref:Uncharacterized protein n=1 Tax=Croceicoccus naphthovorans TaxID=1348774 RepID=A0A0G3XF42_9SPHN|nr:DoxX family protein [Croceicoccus naphthovorans]AKM09822.1 hypothetical protein AB433_07225 [Croceicoccus naphthovorans]MBB3991257.1 putative membrane protein [Croceicoccus naphthovorans]